MSTAVLGEASRRDVPVADSTTSLPADARARVVLLIGTAPELAPALMRSLQRRGATVHSATAEDTRVAARAHAPELIVLLGDAAHANKHLVLQALENERAVRAVVLLGEPDPAARPSTLRQARLDILSPCLGPAVLAEHIDSLLAARLSSHDAAAAPPPPEALEEITLDQLVALLGHGLRATVPPQRSPMQPLPARIALKAGSRSSTVR